MIPKAFRFKNSTYHTKHSGKLKIFYWLSFLIFLFLTWFVLQFGEMALPVVQPGEAHRAVGTGVGLETCITHPLINQ